MPCLRGNSLKKEATAGAALRARFVVSFLRHPPPCQPSSVSLFHSLTLTLPFSLLFLFLYPFTLITPTSKRGNGPPLLRALAFSFCSRASCVATVTLMGFPGLKRSGGLWCKPIKIAAINFDKAVVKPRWAARFSLHSSVSSLLAISRSRKGKIYHPAAACSFLFPDLWKAGEMSDLIFQLSITCIYIYTAKMI